MDHEVHEFLYLGLEFHLLRHHSPLRSVILQPQYSADIVLTPTHREACVLKSLLKRYLQTPMPFKGISVTPEEV
jgi:hypothetical protein